MRIADARNITRGNLLLEIISLRSIFAGNISSANISSGKFLFEKYQNAGGNIDAAPVVYFVCRGLFEETFAQGLECSFFVGLAHEERDVVVAAAV